MASNYIIRFLSYNNNIVLVYPSRTSFVENWPQRAASMRNSRFYLILFIFLCFLCLATHFGNAKNHKCHKTAQTNGHNHTCPTPNAELLSTPIYNMRIWQTNGSLHISHTHMKIYVITTAQRLQKQPQNPISNNNNTKNRRKQREKELCMPNMQDIYIFHEIICVEEAISLSLISSIQSLYAHITKHTYSHVHISNYLSSLGHRKINKPTNK